MNESLITHIIYALALILLLTINYVLSHANGAEPCTTTGCPIPVPAYDPNNPPGNPYKEPDKK